MIVLKSPREIALMREAGRIVAAAMRMCRDLVKPGISTLEIDREVEALFREHGARPAFKGYRGFPATVCVSINEEVVHGIPAAHRRLAEGDLVGLDLGAIVDGYYADAAFTLPVGEISDEARRLLNVTREALELAIAEARPRRRLGDVSARAGDGDGADLSDVVDRLDEVARDLAALRASVAPGQEPPPRAQERLSVTES